MNRKFSISPSHTTAHLHTSSVQLSTRDEQTPETQHYDDSRNSQATTSQPEISKDNPAIAQSHNRHFNTPEKLLSEIEKTPKSCLNMKSNSLDEFDKKIIMMLFSITAFQAHTMDPILFCMDTKISISCIFDKSFRRIIYPVFCKSIQMIQW